MNSIINNRVRFLLIVAVIITSWCIISSNIFFYVESGSGDSSNSDYPIVPISKNTNYSELNDDKRKPEFDVKNRLTSTATIELSNSLTTSSSSIIPEFNINPNFTNESDSSSSNSTTTTTFVWGFSTGPPQSFYLWATNLTLEEKFHQLALDLNSINATWLRVGLQWGDIEPVIYNYTLIEEVTDELVDEYIENHDWSIYDTFVTILTAHGINLIFVLGCGYASTLPTMADNSDEFISPSAIGYDYYLGSIYLHARACVRRYGDVVKYWQIENELNAAGPTALLFNWRTDDLAWWNPMFLEQLIATLSEAVKYEANYTGNELYTLHNFHTDVPGWTFYLLSWLEYLDIVGVDSYPNYLVGIPVLGTILGLKVTIAKLLVGDSKPVWVLETGYPTAPAERGFNLERQAEYVEAMVTASIDAGAEGILYFTITTSEIEVEPWWEPQAVEPHWGMIKPGFVYTEAWYTYAELIANYSP